MTDVLRRIVAQRVHDPGAIAEAAANRIRAESPFNDKGRTMIIAADHPARGANAVGGNPSAMA
ncbi:Cgl0159 family (beta/alpha)8-fold protein, partial [Amycolatopsis mediterranei]